jgi:hypothetical protein
VTVLLALALALPGAAGAKFPGMFPQGGFLTPSGNIACNVGRLGTTRSPFGIGCAVFSKSTAAGIGTWWMRTTGPVQNGFIQANPATDYPKLGYSRAFTWKGIRCVSATTGLTCRNASRHGFFLSRERQRVF